MSAVFLKLLNMSIAAGWLVVAIIVLRLCLKKAPIAIHCALWALVAIRLLCPFSLESNFSLIPEEVANGNAVSGKLKANTVYNVTLVAPNDPAKGAETGFRLGILEMQAITLYFANVNA